MEDSRQVGSAVCAAMLLGGCYKMMLLASSREEKLGNFTKTPDNPGDKTVVVGRLP